jgi:hypothetical protein
MSTIAFTRITGGAKIVIDSNPRYILGTVYLDPSLADDKLTITPSYGDSVTVLETDTVTIEGVAAPAGADAKATLLANSVFGTTSSSVVRTATGTITTQNLNASTGTGTTGSTVELVLNGAGMLSVQVTGTYTSAFTIQVTNDGTNWITRGNTAILSVSSGAGGAAMGSAAQGIYTTDVAGFYKARVTALSAVTGTATLTLYATQATGSVVINNPLPTGANTVGAVNLAPATTQGFSTYSTLVAAATTNATSVKASAGTIGFLSIHNNKASVIYLKIFNKASAPTMGTDTPVFNFGIPAGQTFSLYPAMGIRLSTGIAFAVTGGQALLDTTALVAGDAVININYT